MNQLCLPKTKLMLRDEVLVKLSDDDETTASYTLDVIKDVRIEKRAGWLLPILVFAISIGLALVSRVYIPSPGWAWAVTIVFLGVAGFCPLIIFTCNVVIETNNGTVAYPVVDADEEAEGFVLTLKQMLLNAESQEPAATATDSGESQGDRAKSTL